MHKWELMPDPDGKKFKCGNCQHEDNQWAEREDLIQVGGVPIDECTDETKKRLAKGDHDWDGTLDGKEVCNQVRCPSCKSWYYWEQD